MSKSKDKREEKLDIVSELFYAGEHMVSLNPLFMHLKLMANIRREENGKYPQNGLASVTINGVIRCNPKCRAEPAKWARAIAHCLLHLGMGHFVRHDRYIEWNIACDYVVEKFLSDLGFGKPWYNGTLSSVIKDEDKLYHLLCDQALTSEQRSEYTGLGTAGHNAPDMVFTWDSGGHYRSKLPDWTKLFARGLSRAVTIAVKQASTVDARSTSTDSSSQAESARQWFLSRYPLLGAIAANFKIIVDYKVCQRMDITIAAVSPSLSEIYINPVTYLDPEELRFVLAHEFLHAALRHDVRKEWRDAFLWNIACDFVINGWLTDMGVGSRPDGLLYDDKFKGASAEAVYDHIVTDMRTYRKLATLRGVGLGDILPGETGRSADIDLDSFYRRALSQGLEYHSDQGRGYLPVGLIEEIRALSHPPIPWDVELARWFDEYFSPIEKKRSYARTSRRQSSTPDIPCPNWVISNAALDGRTFGVVLDTSGSMERSLLATALGAIASYSAARDIPAARVVFCDAESYDAGYMKPEDIAGTVKVKGRGGTVLQPGIDLLKKAEDFPEEAPILVITDGQCDKVILYGREHAFLIPGGATLPFAPKGKVFRISG